MPHDPSSILLTGRVAVVTGAGQGLGKATSQLFARFGASVAFCDRIAERVASAGPEIEAAGDGRVLGSVLDVRDRQAARSWIEEIAGELGRIDILVNNAGGSFFAPFTSVNDKGESMLVDENFTQVATLVRAALPHMPTGSSIINITSSEAHQAAPGFAIYAAMKAALASLTRSLALELAPAGVRVNAIAPDAVRTEGEAGSREQVLATAPLYDPVRTPPLGYLAGGDEVAAAAVFLASDLSRFITGTTLHVDGGIWAAGGWRRTSGQDG